jgi:ComF family protein
MAATVHALATSASAALLDLLMPPACAACKEPVVTAHGLCAACFAALPRLPHPLCSRCGTPMPPRGLVEEVCIPCRDQPPPFASARAPFAYDGPARALVLRFKTGREELAPLMARMILADGPLPADALLVPVPLHRSRLLRRGYNQSALLAGTLARMSGLVHAPELLVRIRATPSSRGLTRAQRRAKVAGAFAVPAAHRPRLAGAVCVLVDDVLTTGSTAGACAAALLRAGAAEVHVRTFARVARDVTQS